MSEFLKLIRELLAFEAIGHAPLDALLKARDQLRGNQDLSSIARGRLVHPGGAPIGGLVVELWDDDLTSGDDFLGDAVADEAGRFSIPYAPSAAGIGDLPDFVLRVYEPPQRFVSGGHERQRRVQVERIRGPRNVRENDVDLGDLELAFYEYESKVPFPYTSRESLRRDFVPGASRRFFESLAKWGAIHDRIVLCMRLGSTPTTAEVQAAYPKTATTLLDEKTPGTTRSDAYFAKRILDGFLPAQFQRRADDANGYHLAFSWSKFELNGLVDLPDIAARFELRDGDLYPTEIRLAFRAPNGLRPPGSYGGTTTYTPDSGPPWDQAKRVFRTLYFGVYAQLYGHVATAHFNMEQYAIAMNRNLRRSPIRDVLMPHLKEVSNINDRGRTLLLGADDGLFARSKPITLASQLTWIASNVGRHDWFGFSPRAPISPKHVYARAANLYWEAIHEHLEQLFHEKKASIAEHWHEVVAFERDLLDHSVPLTTRPMEMPDEALEWVDANEQPREHANRVRREDGSVAAMSSITEGGTCTDEALERLRQLCAYCIYYTTFVHGWFHTQQNAEFGEILYAQMLTNGSMSAESDPTIMPDAELQSLGLRVTHSLTDFDWGYLLKNEDGDVPQGLIDAVVARKAAFDEIGFDIATLRSRLNS